LLQELAATDLVSTTAGLEGFPLAARSGSPSNPYSGRRNRGSMPGPPVSVVVQIEYHASSRAVNGGNHPEPFRSNSRVLVRKFRCESTIEGSINR
jgi:hypothetical protein